MLTALVAAVCFGRPSGIPAWLARGVIYQIEVDRFENGDRSNDPPGVQSWNDEPKPEALFGGDYKGIEDRWDHISSLGVSALLVVPSPQAGDDGGAKHLAERENVRWIDPAKDKLDWMPAKDKTTAWREALIGFLKGGATCKEFGRRLEELRNGDGPWLNTLDDPAGERLALTVKGDPNILKQAALIQFICPGTPVVNFGDEIGLKGASGRTMSWNGGSWNHGLLTEYKTLIPLRRKSMALIEGQFETFVGGVQGKVLGLARTRGVEHLIALVNDSDVEQTVRVPSYLQGFGSGIDLLGSGQSGGLSTGQSVTLKPRGLALYLQGV